MEGQINTFTESQHFNQVWIWVVLIAAGLIPVGTECIMWFTKNPGASPAMGAIISVFMMLFSVGLIRMLHLKTKVNEQGISYQLFPLHTRFMLANWDKLEKVYVRKYRPIREYGGWGMRISLRNGTAYNINGNMGLQLIFKGGKKKILIGTQKPEQLNQLLEQFAQHGIISAAMITPPVN